MFVSSIHIKSTSNQDVDLPAETIEAFQGQLRGELVLPGDDNYDEVRQLYNAMIDKRPAMIVRCKDVADV
ncbi:MAG: FAD-linked oxidase, partial [Thermodesulfobacteriota bacterium]